MDDITYAGIGAGGQAAEVPGDAGSAEAAAAKAFRVAGSRPLRVRRGPGGPEEGSLQPGEQVIVIDSAEDADGVAWGLIDADRGLHVMMRWLEPAQGEVSP